MIVTSAKYINSNRTVVEAVIDGEQVFVPKDQGNSHYKAVADWVKAGNTISPAQAVVPDRLSRRKFKMQLEISGLTNAVEAWIDAQPKLIKIAFRESGEFVRTDAMLQKGFTDLGFTQAQIDAFFTAGDAL